MARSFIFAATVVVERAVTALLLIAMAYLLGANRDTDVYFVVLFIPAAFSTMAIDVSFVTVLQTLSRIETMTERHRTAWHMIWASVCVSVLCAAVVFALAPSLTTLIAPGFDSAAHLHATQLQRWTSLLLIANGVGSVVASILISDGRVTLGACRSASNGIIGVVSSLAFYAAGAHGIDAFVFGMVSGAVVTTAGLVILLLASREHRRAFSFGFGDLHGLGFTRIALATAALGAIPQFQTLVERMIGSFLPPGSLMLINLARTLYTFMTFLPGAIANARYTHIVEIPASERHASQTAMARSLLETSIFGSLPVVLSVLVCARDIVGLLYGHGRIDPQTLSLLRTLATVVALGFPACLLGTPLNRIFQMFGRNRELVKVRIGWFAIYAVCAYALARLFGIVGLALDDMMIANNLLFLTLYLRFAGFCPSAAVNRELGAVLAIGLIALGAGWLVHFLLPIGRPDLVAIAAVTATVFTVYGALAWRFNLHAARGVARRGMLWFGVSRNAAM